MSLLNTSSSKAKVLVAAGGTGGHVFPALAVCEELSQRNVSTIWVGTAAGLESRVVPEANIPMHLIDVVGWRGKSLFARIKAPFLMMAACLSVMRLVRKENIAVILGMGGFVSAAAGVVAVLLRKPLILQEQNAVVGSTNRWLSSFASQIFTGFPEIFSGNKKAFFSGNPIRKEFLSFAEKSQRVFPQPGESLRLLVVGGSLGARPINQLMPETVLFLHERLNPGQSLSIVHQTGRADYESVKRQYDQCFAEISQERVNVRVEAFIDDMAVEMSSAHMLIARAGALSVSEALLMGLPSVLIPLPHAIDDHQTANAKVLADAGAAILLPQKELSAEILASSVSDILSQSNLWQQMVASTKQLARPEAAVSVANACIEYVDA